VTILDAIHDAKLLRPLFKDLATWQAWLVVLRAIFGLPMSDEDLSIFRQLTGRQHPPAGPVSEAWLICGRRSGKSFIVALIAAFLACFRDYRSCLGPGERGVIPVIATDKKQSRIIMRYLKAILQSVPMLAGMIEREDTESIDLTNGVTIEIMTASYRTIRGYTVLAALCDEIAFWRSEESSNPAEEILAALRPAMATIPGALLLGLSSPYKRSGPLYEAHKRHYGKDESSVLIVQSETRRMNPCVPQSIIDRAMELDPAAASAEYLAQFRSDVGTFLDYELIEQAIERGRHERAPQDRYHYTAFCDPSGGVHDSFALSIAHTEGERYVLDVCRGIKPPFDPSAVAKEFSNLLKSYRCYTVTGDRYSGEWVREAFDKNGITYQHSELTKSELYLEVLPLFSQGALSLLDIQPLTLELMQLERRTARSGKDSIDHPPGGRDDLANACCGNITLCSQQGRHQVQMYDTGTGRPLSRQKLRQLGIY
jgi:hypothetical protein